MADVDAISRRYVELISTHVGVASILKDRDLQQHPDAYHHKYFLACKKSKMNIVPNPIEPIPIFTTQNFIKGSTAAINRVLLYYTPIISHEVIFTNTFRTNPIEKFTQASKSSEMSHRAMQIPICMYRTIISVRDIIDSLHALSQKKNTLWIPMGHIPSIHSELFLFVCTYLSPWRT